MAGGRALSYPGHDVLEKVKKKVYKVKEFWRVALRVTALFGANLLSAFAMYVMMNYLTNVWNLSITHAAGIINIFDGITSALVIVFAFFVDAFLGDLYMLVLSTIAYSVGLGLLSLSTPTFFGPCSRYKEECIGHKQKVMFFAALPLIAVGMAGHVVSSRSFLEQQYEARAPVAEAETPAVAAAETPAEAAAPAVAEAQSQSQSQAQAQAQEEVGMPGSFVSLLSSSSLQPVITVFISIIAFGIGLVTGAAILITLLYVKPWSIQFGLPAICTVTATLLFFSGYGQYKYIKPEWSPFRVFVAAATKDFQQVEQFTLIYNDDDTQSTSNLRWLDKAAIKFPDQAMSKSWTLCTVREVEDTKTGIRMVPKLLTFMGTGVVLSLGNTYFIEQANHMDRKVGKIKIPIPFFKLWDTPIGNLFGFLLKMMFASNTFDAARNNFDAMSVDVRLEMRPAPTLIALGMVWSVLCCIIAAAVETKRLDVIRNHGLLDKSNERIPMTVFYLLPQYLLLGVVREYINSGLESFLKENVPESMHKYLLHFQKFVLGIGSLANVLLVYVVGKASETNNNPNWFQHTSNKSRLDRYYWTLAALSAFNLVIFAIVFVCKYDIHWGWWPNGRGKSFRNTKI
ncbi:hypothetical protein L1987_84910 [Smallanthus sonchifolius]|uniref:Uncharacterized protein n=1 Tax=Smallanthus sonchifolius TaxID=185202 RepID=A0ACB8XW36_9ASTR|nr:hypothetical protein L1987_84910 [Smallanthus sonchifolius]